MNCRYLIRLAAALVLVLTLGRAFYLLENPPEIHLDFLELLNNEEFINTPEKDIAQRQWAHHAIIALEFGSKKELIEKVNDLFREICNHEIIKKCHWSVKKKIQEEVFKFYWPYRQYLLSDEFIHKINRNQGNDYVKKIQMEVLSSFGHQQAALLDSDPLQVMDNFFRSTSNSLNFKTDEGVFIREEEGAAYAFGFLEIKSEKKQSEKIFASHIKKLRTLLQTEFYITSPLLYSASGAESSINEANIFSLLSLLAIALLLFLVFSSFIPLFASIFVVVVSVIQGFLFTELIFGRVHIVTLLLGVGTLGVITDYCVHYFIHSSQGTSSSTIKKIIKPLTFSLLTSLSGYLMFLIGSIEELKQLSLFSAISLSSAYLYVLSFFPMFSFEKLNKTSLLSKKFFENNSITNKTSAAYSLQVISYLFILSFVSILTLKFNDDASLLQQNNKILEHQEKKIRSIIGFESDPHSYFILSQDIPTLLLTEENLRNKISRRSKGAFVRGVSNWVPSLKRQEKSQDQYEQLYPIVYQLYTSLGVLGADKKAEKVYTIDSSQPYLEFEKWYEVFEENLIVNDYFGMVNDKHLSRVVQFGGDVLSIGELPQGVYFSDKRAEITRVFKLLRQKILWVLLNLILLVLLVFIIFYGLKKTYSILMPPLFGLLLSSFVSSSCFGFMNLFDCLALILIFFLGIDYSFFMQFSHINIRNYAHLAIFVSLLTTICTFGILIFSATSAAQHFGLTMVVGMIGSYFMVTQLRRLQ